MNYLAHIYLSENLPLVSIGNFIADGIRGKSYTNYPKPIQTGILLHRHIDSYTDSHATVKQSTKKLHANYHHYSGVIVDIFYDHFLAKNWGSYCDIPLDIYAQNFYNLLEDQYDILPERTQNMLPYIKQGNWLVSYASLDGIAQVLSGMNRRTRFKSNMDQSITELQEYYSEFENEFTSFFEDLRQTSHQKLKSLLTNI
ncbi:ACP phosphodiesterase [Formosa sp. S-31]|uniref:acyl carrier protein phosphodiesterase n=1 Tax=Formosa sp. S-31 TaxID=2790949 RepID=UPI003EB8405A